MRTLVTKAIISAGFVFPALGHAHEGHAMAGTLFHNAEHGLWLLAGSAVIAAAIVVLRKRSDAK